MTVVRGRTRARLVLAGVLGAAVPALLAGRNAPVSAVAVSGASTTSGPRPCAEVAGRVIVPLVVDFGTAAPGGPRPLCVTVDVSASGSDVLETRARLLGTPPPRYADSGLLCAIDGIPESGCGARTSSGYAYWSYWAGESGEWRYATLGPADRRARDGIVEGWRFQTGDGTGADQPPRRSPTAPIAATPAASLAPTPGTPPAVAGRDDDGGSAGGLAAGAVVVAALVTSAAVVVRRRQRTDER